MGFAHRMDSIRACPLYNSGQHRTAFACARALECWSGVRRSFCMIMRRAASFASCTKH